MDNQTHKANNSKVVGEWVGYIDKDNHKEFVRFEFDEQWCDLPKRKQYGAKVVQDEGIGVFSVSNLLRFQINTDNQEQTLTGRIDKEGEFILWPVAKSDANLNHAVGGSYRLDNGREFFVFAEKFIFPVWQLNYREEERLVRLFLIRDSTYLSEQCEIFEFSGNVLTVKDTINDQHIGVQVTLYNQENLQIDFAGGYTLAGTLFTPDSSLKSAPYPLVILVHGGGPGLRDDYLAVADLFARAENAVFVYDKRGWGESTGEEIWSDIYALADDAEEVIQQLRSHPKIDSDKIGLWGFSNGGWVAPLAGSRFHDISFVVVFSGSGVSPSRQEQVRRCTVAREVLGASEEQALVLERFWEHSFQFFATGKWTKALEQVIDEVENDKEIQTLPKHQGYPDFLQPVPPKRTKDEWLELGGEDPSVLLNPVSIFGKLAAKVLFVWGEKDSIVPAEESRQAIVAGLPDNDSYSILMVPDAGHQLMLIDDGIIYHQDLGDETQRLMRVSRVYAPNVWKTVTEWVHASW